MPDEKRNSRDCDRTPRVLVSRVAIGFGAVFFSRNDSREIVTIGFGPGFFFKTVTEIFLFPFRTTTPSFASKCFLLSCLVFVGTFSVSAEEQDRRYDSRKIYDPPHVRITEQTMSELRTSLQDPSKDGLAEIQKVLNGYYSQFIDSRRIEEERRLGKIFDEKTNRNTIRLLILGLLSKLSPSGLMRDSPILFELHMLLSKLYNDKKQNAKAIEAALTAIRYRDFSHTEEEFLDERRLAEVYDVPEKQAAASHRRIKEDREKAAADLKTSRDFFHLVEANLIRGKETKISEKNGNGATTERVLFAKDLPALKERITQAEKELERREKEYSDSKAAAYESFRVKKSKEDAQTVYYLAGLIRQSENENKERLKVVNNLSVSGTGIFVLFDYKRNTDFFATAALWELVTKLDPEFKDAYLDLAKELKSSGKKEKAIDFYKKYLDLARKEKTEESKLAETYFAIASLYTELKQNVLASSYYESYYGAEADSKKKKKFAYELGSFFENRTGNLEKAVLFYGDWLKDRSDSENSDLPFSDVCERHRQEFSAQYGISRFYAYARKPREEKVFLRRSIQAYETLSEILRSEESKHSALKKETLEIKKNLLERTDDSTMAQYRLKDLDLQESASRLGVARTKLNSTPVTLAMKRLSVLLEEEKDFAGAKKIYEDIVRIGNEIEVNLSLRNIDRINKILEDGIKREPL
ncbi:hypothetical protein EHQ12_06055 [Leptospira gomenensis]|uniref:Uncharacterized protein n=1 Tax=Leptospira gomenensis TaxID=2484974 RepID=A0A5F1Z1B1_9LEPT|nr:hypothetical protein EHQ17_14665 [Leptospira gomenensis]TGK41751.1 hypothetical protein EHQ12_06055 [Leptospira gomenensis]TGK45319.1 hypothetical protein EHQ07_10330 [Leptospira gomenensis]TGK66232.1 hypothetical protein EHQ13_04065 [Leptospira gomenensis]